MSVIRTKIAGTYKYLLLKPLIPLHFDFKLYFIIFAIFVDVMLQCVTQVAYNACNEPPVQAR